MAHLQVARAAGWSMSISTGRIVEPSLTTTTATQAKMRLARKTNTRNTWSLAMSRSGISLRRTLHRSRDVSCNSHCQSQSTRAAWTSRCMPLVSTMELTVTPTGLITLSSSSASLTLEVTTTTAETMTTTTEETKITTMKTKATTTMVTAKTSSRSGGTTRTHPVADAFKIPLAKIDTGKFRTLGAAGGVMRASSSSICRTAQVCVA